jgi:hypothetical protein
MGLHLEGEFSPSKERPVVINAGSLQMSSGSYKSIGTVNVNFH